MTTPTITMGARDFVASQQGDRKGSPLPRHEEPSPVGWVGAIPCGRPERSTHNLGAHPITIMGLGPGHWKDLTLEARDILLQAAKANKIIYFRTLVHPTVDDLKREIPDLRMESFDYLYEKSESWDTLYQQIAEEVCTLATKEPIIYAVPGHPLIGESSVQLVLQLARQRGLSTKIIAGLSFLEPVCTALELDPIMVGTQIIDATVLAALDSDEIAGKIIPTVPLLVAQVYNRRLASAVKLALSECYPDEWRVKLVRAASIDEDEIIVEMPLYELDRNSFHSLPNHLCTLYVPPVDELTALRLPETLRYVTMRLRREPDGCPWDREQTHQTLTHYVIEETYEVVEALEENDMEKLAEELGDLLLQVYLHAEIARQEGDFAIGDVFEHVNAKLIRRHPHVFGDTKVSGAGQVLQNWEAIKRQERIAAGKDVHTESVLDGVPLAAPALIVAQEYQKRAARTGFDYPSLQRVFAKLEEELQELREATTPEHQLEEIGDVLFMVARLARELKLDAEEALRRANRKFRQRFQAMEEIIREEGRTFSSYNLEEWIELWGRVKS
jgi:tetrapyrrole methylase family protein/MazG family protein